MRWINRSLLPLGVLLGLVLGGAALAPVATADVLPGQTTITQSPKSFTSDRTAALSYTTTQLGAHFECLLTGPGRTGTTFEACGAAPSNPDAAPAPGSVTYTGLAPGSYVFRVRAATPSSTPSGPPVVSEAVPAATWTVVDGPVTTITAAPAGRTIGPDLTWSFTSDQPAVSFSCSLVRPGAKASFAPCGTSATGTGSFTAPASGAGPFVFAVRATSTVTQVTGPDATDDVTVMCSIRTSVCKLTAPGRYSVPGGARFNNPLGTSSSKRRLVDHVIATVNSMPGFDVDPAYCSNNPADFPSTIRVSLYSVTNDAFGRAMVNAANRCVSTQILMNNHLDPVTTSAIKMMRDGLGTARMTSTGVLRRNWARMCGTPLSGGGGCRGGGVLHSKFYLFDAPKQASNGTTRINDTIMVGSSNITGNAIRVQWNNLLTVRGNAGLYKTYSDMFDLMSLNKRESRTLDYTNGNYLTQFWPRGSSDPEMSALRSVRCTGVKGGAGVNGRSIVYINMHAWFGTRGYALAKQVRALYDRGCYVRVLYSFMSGSVFKKLRNGTGSRMAVRRTLFSLDGDKYADVYSHYKMIAASGNVGGNPAARVTWTGSMNFTNNGVTFDEVMMRVASTSVYNAYRDEWNYINKRKSSGTWATFLEPVGGGRPVDEDARRMVQPTSPQVVLPPASGDEALPTD